ncbi:MAG TPA: hypothetical protein DDZ88_16085, partial [Verrucomicrobiales bacterium]|nr:hypothetical protein [Verrucomicrobiales bacterium]
DIKPSNIMLDKKGRVKVADFGLAKTLNIESALMTRSDVAMGTPDFIAPEAMMPGMKVDGRADLYAVGVMLYQMLTGKIPRGRFELPSRVIPMMDKGFDAIVDKAMQTDRENRYSTATEMRQHLDTLLMPAVPVPDLQRHSSVGMPNQAPQASKPGVVTARLAAAAPNPDGRAGATPILPSKSRMPLFISIGATAVMAVGAFVLFDGKKPAPAPLPPALESQATPLPPELTAQQLVDAAKTASTTEPPQSGQRLTAALAPAAMLALKDGITNALGMKFLPVKGTEVMFCIHETRRQDYAAYAAKVHGVDGAWRTQQRNGIPCGDKNDHPVVGVSWEDAQKFCEWLSREEGKAYRLPTDEEWSIAVGLGLKERHGKDITPKTLNQKDQTEFPWSDDYPPKTKDKAGNYADTAWTEKFPSEPGMKDYTDGFPTTAPVMSFKPNQFGLYDMGGNVWEWCEDWYDKERKVRVLRGGSWTHFDHGNRLSSSRDRGTPSTRSSSSGFRVVLAPVAASEGRSAAPSSAANSPTATTTPNTAHGGPSALLASATNAVPFTNIPPSASPLSDEWEPPVNLGPAVNTPHSEVNATLSADELALVIDGPNGRLWESSRPNVDAAFSMARNIPALDNDPAVEKSDPCLSPDGLMLYYSAKPPPEGGDNGWRLYQTRRNSRDAAWEAPKRLGPPASDHSGFVQHPVISADGLTLLFDNGSGTDNAILRCRRASLDAPFDKPEALWRGKGSIYPCWLSPDQTSLFFTEKAHKGSDTTFRLNVAKLTADQVSEVQPLTLPCEGSLAWCWLSPDGMTLYFSSNLPGGRGGMDLYMMRRKATAGPLFKTAATSPDRMAALRVLEKGGKITVEAKNGRMSGIATAAGLPAEEFFVTDVEMSIAGNKPNNFDDTDMLALSHLSKVSFVGLGETNVSGTGLAVLKTLPSLSKLNLRGNPRIKDEDLAQLRNCRLLSFLNFGNIGSFTSAAFEQLSKLVQLTELDPPGVVRDEDLKHFLRLPKLRVLKLEGSVLSADALEQLQSMPALEELDVDLASVDRSVNFADFPNLTQIYCGGLTVDAVKSLATASHLQLLTIRAANGLSPAALGQFTLTPLVKLKNLTFNLNKPLPPGDYFAALPKLERVHVGNHGSTNAFDDAALLGLAKVATLKTVVLEVAVPLVTSQGLATFRKLRPDVKIEGSSVPKESQQSIPPSKPGTPD